MPRNMDAAQNPIRDAYKGIASPSEGLYKELGSRFIASAWPIEGEEEARRIVDSLRKEYHDARHHCFAYRIGHLGDRFRASDDGEPAGTAGRPILGQIDSRGLSDTLVVVVRYFGGVKLGVPGLIRAYRSAAADALDRADIAEKVASKAWRVLFPYDEMNAVMKLFKEMGLPQNGQDFGLDCRLGTRVRLTAEQDFLTRLGRINGARAELI